MAQYFLNHLPIIHRRSHNVSMILQWHLITSEGLMIGLQRINAIYTGTLGASHQITVTPFPPENLIWPLRDSLQVIKVFLLCLRQITQPIPITFIRSEGRD